MADYDALIERYSGRYQDRLHYLDELLAEAERQKGVGPGDRVTDEELVRLRREREQLLQDAERLKNKTRDEWQGDSLEEAGPMIMWQEVARKLEGLIERIGRVRH